MDLKIPTNPESADLAMLLTYAGMVQRTHVVPDGEGYSIAQHSWNMAMLYLSFCDHPQISVLTAILLHDVPELWTGDVPAPTKRRYPSFKILFEQMDKEILSSLGLLAHHESHLTEVGRAWLKACDLCELLLWSKRKVQNGYHVWSELRHNCAIALETLDHNEWPNSTEFDPIRRMASDVLYSDYKQVSVWI